MKSILKRGLWAPAAALVLALAACSGVQIKPLDQAAADELAPVVVDEAMSHMSWMQSPSLIVPMSTGTQATMATKFLATAGISPQQSGECTPELSGDPTDADGDTIPANETTTFTCHISSENGNIDITGSLTVTDRDDNDLPGETSGFTIEAHNLMISSTFEGVTVDIKFNGSYALTIGAGSYNAAIDMTVFVGSSNGSSASVAFDSNETYTPDSMAAPFDGGKLGFSGSLTLITDDTGYRLESSTDPDLVYDPVCETGFFSGTAHYSDSSGNTLDITFACDTYTATFVGAP